MKRLILFIGIVAVGLGLNSCNNDDGVNFHFTALEITSVQLPATFQLGARYQVLVNYIRPDDCTYFEGFDIVKKDTTVRNVVVVGSVIDDKTCVGPGEEMQATFTFEVRYDQTYIFRFWQGEDENGDPIFLEIQVPVE